MQAFGKELRQINRDYPIFIYDNYRFGGTDYEIIKKAVTKRKYAYIRLPLYHLLNDDMFAISKDKTVLKYLKNPFTEGDLLYFNDTQKAVEYFDFKYHGYERKLINIPIMSPHPIIQVPAWIYIKPKLTFCGHFIKSGDVFDLTATEPKELIPNKMNSDKKIIKDTIKKLGGKRGAYIEDVIKFSGVKNAENLIIKNMKKMGEVFFPQSGMVRVLD